MVEGEAVDRFDRQRQDALLKALSKSARQGRLAVFDAQQIVDAVQAGSVPDSWTVFRAGSAYDIEQGSAWALIAFVFLGISLAPPVLTLPIDSSDLSIFWVIGFVFGLPGLGFAYAAYRQFRRIPTVREQWITLTPGGVVEYRGAKSGIVFAMAYSQLAKVSSRCRTYPVRNHHFAQRGLPLLTQRS